MTEPTRLGLPNRPPETGGPGGCETVCLTGSPRLEKNALPPLPLREGQGACAGGGSAGAAASRAMPLLLIAVLGLFVALYLPADRPETPPIVLAAYATDLAGRTPHQRYNARRAAAALDGTVIPAGGVFSFNDRVRGWTADRGFLKAPVSYDGVLVDDYGGGVCETSTTVYNAALLAGAPILERYAHTFSPSYAPPGRDAAVAYTSADLRFRNPFSWPLTLHIRPEGHQLICRLESPSRPARRVVLMSRVVDRFTPPPAPVQPGVGVRRSRWRLEGRDGVHVLIFRDFYTGGQRTRREIVSDNTYLPISRAQWSEASG